MIKEKGILFAVLLVAFMVLLFCSDNKAGAEDSYNAYIESIDRSCRADADCVIKDIGNCCGYYPECVNANAVTDEALVEDYCQKTGMGSVCGFPAIESCRCQIDKCMGVESGAEDSE